MRCRRIRRQLQAGDGPSAEARASIEAHLAACAACRGHAREIERLRGALSALAQMDGALEGDAGLVGRVASRLREIDDRPRGLRAWLAEAEVAPLPSFLQAGLVLWIALAGTLRFPAVESTLREWLGL